MGIGCRLEYIADRLSYNSLTLLMEFNQMKSVAPALVRNISPCSRAHFCKRGGALSTRCWRVLLMMGHPGTCGGRCLRRLSWNALYAPKMRTGTTMKIRRRYFGASMRPRVRSIGTEVAIYKIWWAMIIPILLQIFLYLSWTLIQHCSLEKQFEY